MSPDNDRPAEITLIVPRNAPVSSIYNGSVVDCYYTVGQGYTYIIQHPNGFMSKYSGLGSAFADKGQHVDTGSAIGLTGNSANSTQNLVTFELWNKGTPAQSPGNTYRFDKFKILHFHNRRISAKFAYSLLYIVITT